MNRAKNGAIHASVSDWEFNLLLIFLGDQPRILSLPYRAGSSTWTLGPGCCGFIGPVPSATLDKRHRKVTFTGITKHFWIVNEIRELLIQVSRRRDGYRIRAFERLPFRSMKKERSNRANGWRDFQSVGTPYALVAISDANGGLTKHCIQTKLGPVKELRQLTQPRC